MSIFTSFSITGQIFQCVVLESYCLQWQGGDLFGCHSLIFCSHIIAVLGWCFFVSDILRDRDIACSHHASSYFHSLIIKNFLRRRIPAAFPTTIVMTTVAFILSRGVFVVYTSSLIRHERHSINARSSEIGCFDDIGNFRSCCWGNVHDATAEKIGLPWLGINRGNYIRTCSKRRRITQ